MTGALLVLGISHKTAPLSLRERVALPEGRAAQILDELVGLAAVHEAVALSTCNRTELYLVASDGVEAESAALSILSREADIRPTELVGHIYSRRDREAVRHLFAVAAGLDSMIVGEAEVQGQVKRAYELALVEGATGPVTNRLFRDAIGAGKRVRTETGIGRSRVSVASVAVDIARRVLGELETRRVLVIGAGENSEVTANALHERGVETVFVANRRYDRAISLAERFGGQAVRFDDLPRGLTEADIVVSSTASPHVIVDREELAVVLERRGGRPLLMIDIAVPRDIHPAVRELPGITLYDMDDLQREVDRNRQVHENETVRAGRLVDEEVDRFGDWLSTLEVVPTIAALRERGEQIVEQVLRENEARWVSLSEDDRGRVEMIARAIVSRMLHEPTIRLKSSSSDDGSYVYLQALRELFGLEPAAGLDLDSTARPGTVSSLDEHRRGQRPR